MVKTAIDLGIFNAAAGPPGKQLKVSELAVAANADPQLVCESSILSIPTFSMNGRN